MKTAIISDIHSNLEALTAVLSVIDALPHDEIVCLGDIVGYGANPDECVDVIRERKIPAVMGNHDKAAAGLIETDDFSQMAKAGIAWSKKSLKGESLAFLKALPLIMETPDILYVHSSPDNPGDFRYLIYPSDAFVSYDSFSQKVCFVGHTHRPVIFDPLSGESAVLTREKSIVNVGSVGQPRDGDWRACFALFDSERWSVEFFRVEYDNETARRKILEAGLPQRLGDRLLVGV